MNIIAIRLWTALACVGLSAAVAEAQTIDGDPWAGAVISAERLPTKRVTVSATNAPIREVFSQMKAQTGTTFTLGPGQLQLDFSQLPATRYPLDDRLITLEATDQPAWDVLERLLGQTKSVSWGMGRPVLGKPGSEYMEQYAGRAQAMGPFLLVATRVHHEVDFRYVASVAEDFYLEGRVIEEPSMQMCTVVSSSVPTKALDERGNSLIPARAITAFESGSNPRQPAFRIALHRPPNSGRKIAVVEGTIALSIIVKTEVVELQVPGVIEKQYGPVRVKFSATEGDGKDGNASFVVTQSLERPAAMTDVEWTRWKSLLLPNNPRLLDAEGKQWEGRTSVSGGGYRQESRRRTAGPAVKAMFEVGTEVQRVSIPYRFVDLPLP